MVLSNRIECACDWRMSPIAAPSEQTWQHFGNLQKDRVCPAPESPLAFLDQLNATRPSDGRPIVSLMRQAADAASAAVKIESFPPFMLSSTASPPSEAVPARARSAGTRSRTSRG